MGSLPEDVRLSAYPFGVYAYGRGKKSRPFRGGFSFLPFALAYCAIEEVSAGSDVASLGIVVGYEYVGAGCESVMMPLMSVKTV